MPVTSVDAEREYDGEQVSTVEFVETDRIKTVCAYFEPGQFIPVHAPASDVVIVVQSGSGIVREGDTDHAVESGSVVVVTADTDRGIRADSESQLEAVLVASPPPTEAERESVHNRLQSDAFDPSEREE